MRSLFFCIILFLYSLPGWSTPTYLLSSETLMQGNRSSLKGYTSFTFNALLETTGKGIIPSWMLKELNNKGALQTENVLTPQGIDFTKMPRNFLTFSIEQLVDTKGLLLPVMRVKLVTSTSVIVAVNQETHLLDTNEWAVYVSQKEIEPNISKIFSELLQQFLNHYQAENTEKPLFCIFQKSKLADPSPKK